MKYSVEEFEKVCTAAHRQTCLYEEFKELTKEAHRQLHQGLELGDGVTISLWTDSHACTVVRRTKNTLWAQRDKAIRTDNNGVSDCQEYIYEPDPNGTVYVCHWSEKHAGFFYGGTQQGRMISVGRHEYYDYSF